MKRWAALTVIVYLVILTGLVAPLAFAGFAQWPWLTKEAGIKFREALEIYEEVGFWIWLALMGLGAAFLLLVPIGIAERRLEARRPLFLPVLTTGFFTATLWFAGAISLLCAIRSDNGLEMFDKAGELLRTEATENWLTAALFKSPAATVGSGFDLVLGVACVMAVCWLFWSILFYKFAREDDPETLVKRFVRWLLHGSILELLVAVPSHIIVRNRHDCCAPFGTFWAITMGLSIMLLCFGPGVFFLFAERFARIRPKAAAPQHLEVH